jgi:GT2 family glycosyltransferase
MTVALPANVTAGDTVILLVGMGDNNIPVTGVTGDGVTWNEAVSYNDYLYSGANDGPTQIWYGTASSGRTGTATISFGGSIGTGPCDQLNISEYSGIANLDQASTDYITNNTVRKTLAEALSMPNVGSLQATQAITAGTLSFAVTPAAISFSTITLNGRDQTSAAMQVLDIGDNTGSGSGWNVTLSNTSFTSSTHVLSNTDFTAASPGTPVCDTGSSCAAATWTGNVSYPYVLPGTTATKLLSATACTEIGGLDCFHCLDCDSSSQCIHPNVLVYLDSHACQWPLAAGGKGCHAMMQEMACMADTVKEQLAAYAATELPKCEERYRSLMHRERMQEQMDRFLPHGSLQYRTLHKGRTVLRTLNVEGPLRGSRTLLRALRGKRPAADRTSPDAAAYRAWCASRGARHEKLLAYGAQHAKDPDAPLISIVLPTYRSDLPHLRAALKSVREQAYTKWELLIVDDASHDAALLTELESLASEDPRIRLLVRHANGGIARATQDGIAMATGEYITFLDHDDAFLPFTLAAVAEAIGKHPRGDVFYSDEIVISADGSSIIDVALKPGFSPQLLLSTNYICHLLVIRHALLAEVGGMREGYDGSQDYDLILRATESAQEVVHIPEVLYLWNEVPGSVITGTAAKPYAYEAGRRALHDAYERRGITHLVPTHGLLAGWYTCMLQGAHPSCSIVIPDLVSDSMLQWTIDAVRRTTDATRVEIIVVSTHGSAFQKEFPGADRAVSCRQDELHIPQILNAGAEAAAHPNLLFLAPGMIPTEKSWLNVLLSYLSFPGTGAVAPRIVTHEGRQVSDRYVTPGGGALPRLLAASHWPLPREVSAVPWSCMAVRKDAFLAAGALDGEYTVQWFDVDLAFRLMEQGRSIISVPTVSCASLYDAPFLPVSSSEDGDRLQRLYPLQLDAPDPYLHPAVTSEYPYQFKNAESLEH